MAKRQVEVFTAGCPICDPTVQLVQELACSDCDMTVQDVRDPAVAARAASHGVRTIPAVAVDGHLASCCEDAGPTRAALVGAGIGQPR